MLKPQIPLKLCVIIAIVLMFSGTAFAGYTSWPGWHRPEPCMDYTSQEIGVLDTLYTNFRQGDCQRCHGTDDEVADRHHFGEKALRDRDCTFCHNVGPPPDYGIVIERNCMAIGCHDTTNNKWHHTSFSAGAGQCNVCHDPNIVSEVGPYRDPDDPEYPATDITPSPFSCENCHWWQNNVVQDDALVSNMHTGANNQPVLTDVGATFIASGVQVGMLVKNTTDGSIGEATARTITTITFGYGLSGGTDNDWDTNDAYSVLNYPPGNIAGDIGGPYYNLDDYPGAAWPQIGPAEATAGHPSTYDHWDPWGNFTGYYDYDHTIFTNYETHHMTSVPPYPGFGPGDVANQCAWCHSDDPEWPLWTNTDPRLIRYCEKCHTPDSLHRIGPHVADYADWNDDGSWDKYPGGIEEGFSQWEADGWHSGGHPNQFDWNPTVYKHFGPYPAPDPEPANGPADRCVCCHGDQLDTWDAPVVAFLPSIYNPPGCTPKSASAYGIIELIGDYFGEELDANRLVEMKLQGTGWLTKIQPDPEILSWTNNLIEFRVPGTVGSPAIPAGTYRVRVKVEDRGITVSPFEVSNEVFLTILDHISLMGLERSGVPGATSGPWGCWIQMDCDDDPLYNGDLPPGRTGSWGAPPYVTNVVRMAQFVQGEHKYIAKAYTEWDAPTQDKFKVRFRNIFDDLNGNYFQDINEPSIFSGDDMFIGPYNVTVKTVTYLDDDGILGVSANDTIVQVETSDSQVFDLNNDPVIHKLTPKQAYPSCMAVNSADCGVNRWKNIVWATGDNFGPTTGAIFHIGNAFNCGPGHWRIKSWTNTRIKFKVPPYNCAFFGASSSRNVPIWVTIPNAPNPDSNKKRLKVLKPTFWLGGTRCP